MAKTKTLQELHEIHSELCFTAIDLGMAVSEDLTYDFDTVEDGQKIVSNLEDLIRAKLSLAGPVAAEKASFEKKKKSCHIDPRQVELFVAPVKRGTTKKALAAGPIGAYAKITALLKRDGGCTRADILEATGWKAVSPQQVAAKCGLTLNKSEERPFKYWVV